MNAFNMISTIRLRTHLLVVLILIASSSFGQTTDNDFSTWYWIQAKYKVNKRINLNFQFQSRLNHNSTDFDKSNLFFSGEYKLNKTFSAEILTQYTTNYSDNQYTLYGGITYRHDFKFVQFYYRTSIQSKRDHFTSDFNYDNPYSEWRNRIRFSFPLKKDWLLSLSTEPYLNIQRYTPFYFSRIRNIVQVSYDLNDFQNIAVFYLVEPTLNKAYSTSNNFVLGITYQFQIPQKKKEFKHFFDYKKKDKDKKKEAKENYQFL